MTGLTPTHPTGAPSPRPAALGRRRLRPIHGVAVACSLLAALTVYALFDRFGVLGDGPGQGERRLVATVDLRIGNPAAWGERGEAAAREDLKAGLLQLQVFGPETPPGAAEKARAERWKAQYGVTWHRKAKAPTLLTQAFAEAYNRVMQAEIERRHGAPVLKKLLAEQREAFPPQEPKDAP